MLLGAGGFSLLLIHIFQDATVMREMDVILPSLPRVPGEFCFHSSFDKFKVYDFFMFILKRISTPPSPIKA